MNLSNETTIPISPIAGYDRVGACLAKNEGEKIILTRSIYDTIQSTKRSKLQPQSCLQPKLAHFWLHSSLPLSDLENTKVSDATQQKENSIK